MSLNLEDLVCRNSLKSEFFPDCYNDECIYDECWQEFPPDASDIAAVKADFANDAAKCDEL